MDQPNNVSLGVNNGKQQLIGPLRAEPSESTKIGVTCARKSYPIGYSYWLGCVRSDVKTEERETMDVEGKVSSKDVKKKYGGWKTMPFIFGNELGEKLAVIGFSANLITYLTQQLHMDSVEAATTLTNFGGTASLTPLVGAFLADAYVGRFWTITVGSIFYLMGMSLFTFAAIKPSLRPPSCSDVSGQNICMPPSRTQLALLYVALLLTATGSGGIRPCVAAFGADQFDKKDPKQEKKLWSFFNWYYFCMGASSLIAVTVIVYVQDNVGWGWGFGIPAIAMIISILGLVIALPLYVQVPPMGSPLNRLTRVSVAAYRKRNLPLPLDLSSLYEPHLEEDASEHKLRLLHSNQFKFLDKAAIKVEEDTNVQATGKVNPWRLCTVTEVEELKSILRMGPIWASGILLITASAQQGTFSVLQAKTMDRYIGSSFQIPPGSMGIFTILGLLLTVPIYDRMFMPLARRITGHSRGITFLQRMGIGFSISTLATLVAGFVEVKRKQAAQLHGLLDRPKLMVPISVFWLLPQYTLHGIAEAFMSIGHLEFFYDQSPESMRSTSTALFWTSISVGSYLSSLLVFIIHKTTGGTHHKGWLSNNLNRGHLEYFFWLLTALQFFNFIFFIFCARLYKYRPVLETRDEPSKENDTLSSAI